MISILFNGSEHAIEKLLKPGSYYYRQFGGIVSGVSLVWSGRCDDICFDLELSQTSPSSLPPCYTQLLPHVWFNDLLTFTQTWNINASLPPTHTNNKNTWKGSKCQKFLKIKCNISRDVFQKHLSSFFIKFSINNMMVWHIDKARNDM